MHLTLPCNRNEMVWTGGKLWVISTQHALCTLNTRRDRKKYTAVHVTPIMCVEKTDKMECVCKNYGPGNPLVEFDSHAPGATVLELLQTWEATGTRTSRRLQRTAGSKSLVCTNFVARRWRKTRPEFEQRPIKVSNFWTTRKFTWTLKLSHQREQHVGYRHTKFQVIRFSQCATTAPYPWSCRSSYGAQIGVLPRPGSPRPKCSGCS